MNSEVCALLVEKHCRAVDRMFPMIVGYLDLVIAYWLEAASLTACKLCVVAL